ncbi:MAG: hypothetical protein WEB09_08105 [Nitriliruptor sp.]
MFASTRRFRGSDRSPITRSARTGVAAFAALSLGLAACGDGGDDAADEEAEIEAPADDGAEDGEAAPEDGTDGELEQPEPVGFEDLEDGEVVPGVTLDAPVDDGQSQAQPTPVGSAYVGSLGEQSGAVTVNVEFDGQSLDELLAGIDTLVESGQAEVTSEPEDVEVEGADEASRIELAAPGGEATATGIFATADGNAISIAIEVLEGSDIDIDSIIDSIVIDPARLQAEGVLELDEAPAPETDGGDPAADGSDAGTAPATEDPATEDPATEPETDTDS